MDFSIGQTGGALGQILKSQIKRVQNGAACCRDFGVVSAKPGFEVGG
jgi:hypothetical protein